MPSAYDDLVRRLQRIGAIGEAIGHLHWDQETYMPKAGVEARAVELATLSSLAHELFTAPEVGRLLAAAEKEETDEQHEALLRETRFQFDRATRVPAELVEALSQATSRALPQWAEARAKSDFSIFRGPLSEILTLRRRYAEHIDPDASPYEVLFQDYEPWLSLDRTRKDLGELRDGLRPLIEKATGLAKPEDPLGGKWDVAGQQRLNQRLLEHMGYDFERGRLDISAHPFSTGNPYDARITTRYDEDDLLSSVLSTIHEMGHSLYTQGLPKEHFGTPLGEARDLAVHESQSRLWENHVGRSLPFMRFFLPIVGEAFPGRIDGVTAEAAWRAANVVEPSFIRVESDELTYHQHIALRFEVEEALVSGKATVDDVPSLWNSRMERYLGIAPPDDARGCLQDVHWAHGSFGYFPTYSLGSMLAAQLYAAFSKEHPEFDEGIGRGEFVKLRGWLTDRVHRHGKRYKTNDLVERATGARLSPDAFLEYARGKVAALAG